MRAYPEEDADAAAASFKQSAKDLAVKRSSADGLDCEFCNSLNASPQKRYRADQASQATNLMLSATPTHLAHRPSYVLMPDASRGQPSSAFAQAYEDPFDSDSEEVDIASLLCDETGAGYETAFEPPKLKLSCLTPSASFAATEQPSAPKCKRTMSRVASLDQWIEDPFGVEESVTANSSATRGSLLEGVAENSLSSSSRNSFDNSLRKSFDGIASDEEEIGADDKQRTGQQDPLLRSLFEACCQTLDAATVLWPTLAEKQASTARQPAGTQSDAREEFRQTGKLAKKGSFSFR